MRVIGLDVHRTFAEVVFLEKAALRSGGRVELTAERLVNSTCPLVRRRGSSQL